MRFKSLLPDESLTFTGVLVNVEAFLGINYSNIVNKTPIFSDWREQLDSVTRYENNNYS